jgi:hypothetical protein
MIEHGMGEDEIDNVDLVRILGSSSIKINRELKTKLHPKIQQILKDPELSEIAESNPSELLRQIIAVAANEITGRSQSSTFSTSAAARSLGSRANDPTEPVMREM